MTDKYLRGGQKVAVLEELSDDRYLVALYYMRYSYDGEEEYYDDGYPFVVHQVFDDPPTPVIAEDVVKLTQAHEELKQQVWQARKELDDLEQRVKEHKKRYAHIPQLAQLDEFLDGQLTHYVMNVGEKPWYLPSILSFKEARTEYDRKGVGRLLGLFGEATGQLDWRLNTYSDGSGSYVSCVPCCSYDEALAVLTKRLHELMENEKSQRLIDLCRSYAIPVPQEYLEEVHEKKLKVARKEVREKRAELDKAVQALSNIETS